MRRFVPPVPSRSSCVRLLTGIAIAVVLALTSIEAQIPGRNINMVAGNTWPDGDPFLQRQNEPSIAASTRNPLHLLAGSNDYRTVDLPGLGDDEIGDAWLGLYKSFDGGQRWISTLLPGYPQDTSEAGMDSPIKGYGAGADPVVRAGNSGLVYYAGLVFDRSLPATPEVPGKSAIFVARFIDNNNKEAGDTFAYLGTRTLQTDPGGPGGNFLDKPWMVVDVPRDDTRCTIKTPGDDGTVITQSVPAGPVYVAYTLRSTDNKGPRYDVYFTRSTNCGDSWTMPVRLNSASERSNQGAVLSIDPRNGDVYIGWRQFDLRENATDNAMMSVKFTRSAQKLDPPGFAHKFAKPKKGKGKGINPEHFYKKGGVSKAVAAANLSPLDQGTSDINEFLAFRTNAYPAMAVDHTGRVYMAWAERGHDPIRPDPETGDARIMMATSADGKTWTAAKAIALEGQQGHQLMPTLTVAGGQLMVVYYDLRETRSAVFSRFIDDYTAFQGANRLRHTIDLRASMAAPGAAPDFGESVRVSDYLMGADTDPLGNRTLRQLQVNPPNLPMFKQGTAPFMGDYIDVAAAPAFIVDPATGKWIYNTAASAAPPIFHATWTDNRDVRVPLEDPDGDRNPWNNYTPPSYNGPSPLDPTRGVPTCIAGNAGSRNQNIYTARITGGLLVGSPGNTKTLSTDLQRGFVVFVQNTTEDQRRFRLTITNQPAGGRASFNQFPLPPFTPQSEPPLTVIEAEVGRRSTISRTVYVTSSDPHARIHISVTELPPAGSTAPPLTGAIILNPDIDNPDIDNPDIDNPDIDNPDIDNAEVYNPDIDNPDIDNPDIDNPDIDNPDIDNPDIDNIVVANPDIDNPDIDNPDIDNPDIDNPDIDNPDIDNPDIDNQSLTDVSWSITNNGNTTAAYNVNLFFAQTTIKPSINTQLILYRTYKTPVVRNCSLKSETRNVLVANVPNPQLIPSSSGQVSNPNDPEITNATIYLAPGESAKITLRIYDPDSTDNVTVTNPDGSTATIDPSLVPNEDVTPVVQQQGVNTQDAEAGVTEPPLVVQFPAPQTVPDAVSTAEQTPVTINVLANDSTAFGSTKVISLHPAGMATHSGAGPGDVTFQPSSGFLYTQRGAIDPVTNALVGRFPSAVVNAGVASQVANPRTGINYSRSSGSPSVLVALDARPGSATFHQYLPIFQVSDSVYAFGLDTTHHRLYVLHGPPTGLTTTTVTSIDINPGSPSFHQKLFAVTLPGNARGQAVAVNPRTQRVYVSATNSGGVWVLDGTLPAPPAVKVANTFGGLGIGINEASNLVFVVNSVNPPPNTQLVVYAIDGATNAMTPINTGLPMQFGSPDERIAVHQSSGRVYIRLATQIVVIDGQRGSPTRNLVVATIPVGRESGQSDMAIDQELGLLVATSNVAFRSDIISIDTNTVVATIGNERGATDVAIDPVSHRAFVSVGLTHVQEIDLVSRTLTASVPVFVESGGTILNPVANKLYTAITVRDSVLGKVSGTGFEGLIPGTLTTGRFLFAARHDATNRYFIINPTSADGTNGASGTVTVIDGATDTLVTDDLETPASPFGIGINQANGKVYVATLAAHGQSGGILIGNANDLEENAVLADTSAILPPAPGGLIGFGRHIVPNPTNGKVYVMQTGNSNTSIAVIDPATNVVTPLDGAAGTPLGTGYGRAEVIRVDPIHNRVYVGMYNSSTNETTVVLLDSNTDTELYAWEGGRHSNRHTASYVVVNPTTERVYVSDYESNEVTVLHGADLEAISTVVVPDGPSAMTINATANRVYVSSIDAKMISVLGEGPEGLELVSSVRLPLTAYFLYADEVESRLYTSGGDSTDESGVMVVTDVLGQLGTTVSVTDAVSTANGSVVLNADHSVTYTPKPGFRGIDTFAYFIEAPTGTAQGTVTVTVAASNPAAVAFGDAYSAGAGQFLDVTAPGPLENDAAGPGATMVVTDTTDFGVLTPQADGAFLYQPNPGFSGVDSFRYHATGPLGDSNTTTVTITVTTPTDLVVTNTNDSGEGSLRQAMGIANVEPNSTIRFAIDGAGPHTISPLTALPTLMAPVRIDGYTQPGALPNTAANGTNAAIRIVVRGNNIAAFTNGFTVNGGSTTIRGLAINSFTGAGILLDLLGGNTVEGNFIGTNAAGDAALPNGNSGVTSQSVNNLIGGASLASRNLVSGNTNAGIRVQVRSSNGVVQNDGSGTMVVNNLVGTAASGMSAIGNSGGGVQVSVPNVTIGGPGALDRNVISGNTGNGIHTFSPLFDPDGAGPAQPGHMSPPTRPTNLVVQGNFIGVNVLGTGAVPNSSTGLTVTGANSLIGGSAGTSPNLCAGACNLIAGNQQGGIFLSSHFENPAAATPTMGTVFTSGSGSQVIGNFIGVNATGTAAIPNGSGGVFVNAPNVSIGGTDPGARNVVSGNTGTGISTGASYVTVSGALVNSGEGVVITGNYVGVNAAGAAAIPNGSNGIGIGTASVTVGGVTPAHRNIVSGNGNSGISSYASRNATNGVLTTPDNLVVQGNYVGTNAAGTASIANLSGGMFISGANSLVGGIAGTSAVACTGACNLVSGNTNPPSPVTAISIAANFENTNPATLGTIYSVPTGTKVYGNFVGTNLDGTTAIPNDFGINVSAPNITVGGPAPLETRNLVAGNLRTGIQAGSSWVTATNMVVATATGSKIQSNYVGVTADGMALLTNTQTGIHSSAPGVIIGGPLVELGNLVAGRAGSSAINLNRHFNGAAFINAGDGNTVQFNVVGLAADGATKLNAGGTGIVVSTANSQVRNNTVAGLGVAPAFSTGISIGGAFATGNTIAGNHIGTNAAGAAGLGNTAAGISMNGGANNTIGGLAAADRNIIVGNGGGGINMAALGGVSTAGTVIQGNYIGVNQAGVAIPNQIGVQIGSNAGSTTPNTVLGGSAAGARNVIAGNTGTGVLMFGTGTTGTVIAGNYIGVAPDGVTARPNTASGINVGDTIDSTIGGASAAEGNLIANNGGPGVAVQTGVRNRILSNAIHANGGLGIDLGGAGVTLNDNGDGDSGGNNLQNYPVLSGATNTNGPATTVNVDLSTTAVGSYTVQFFANTTCDAAGYGEGQRLVGTRTVVQPGDGNVALDELVPQGQFITAVAMDADGNTSEFSACAEVDPPPAIATNTNDSGPGSLRQTIINANSQPARQVVTFNIPGAGPHVLQPLTALPTIASPATIDGTAQPGYVNQPVVEITGASVPGFG